MLVLSRKQDESIYIGDDIVLTILQVQGHRVRLGIDAPSRIAIRRSELPLPAESTTMATVVNPVTTDSIERAIA